MRRLRTCCLLLLWGELRFLHTQRAVAICLEKYIVKSSEFPPSNLKKFRMNRNGIPSCSELTSPFSCWRVPAGSSLAFLYHTTHTQGGKVSSGVSWSLPDFLGFTLGIGHGAGLESSLERLAWVYGASCKHLLCWTQFYYSQHHLPQQ